MTEEKVAEETQAEETRAEETRAEESIEIRCPHCKKTFSGSLLDGAAERYRGFKCPHCRLFVPAARTSGSENV